MTITKQDLTLHLSDTVGLPAKDCAALVNTYPAPLRDLLMRLTLSGLFRAKWTDQIHEARQDVAPLSKPD